MPTERPWLSVIIPSHNGERWLGAALQSVVEQNEQGIEVLVVDSSDSETSIEIVQGFSDALETQIYHRPDLLPWTSKTNFGVAQARADRVCMLHQDDLWLPDRCKVLRNWLSTECDGVMHLHPAYIIDDTDRRMGLWRCPLPTANSPVPAEMLLERLLVQEFVAIPTPTIRRDVFLSVGGMDEALPQTADWDLYLKISSKGNVYYHSEPLACFRIHRNSQTVLATRDLKNYRHQLELVLDRHSGRLRASSKAAILRMAAVSIEVNIALAAANAGNPSELKNAFLSMLKLGPGGLRKYVSYSRLMERVFPRLRARLMGAF